MRLEIPRFSGSDRERLMQLQSFVTELAERINSTPMDIEGVERGRVLKEGDELIITFSDGSKRSYLMKKL